MIERVDFIPLEGLGKLDLRVHGRPAARRARAVSRKQNPHRRRTVGVLACLGAGAGFEPATFRL